MQSVDQRISSLFTKGSHHRNISVIYIVQNLFDQHKLHRTISLNAHYLVVFKNPRDGSQITHLAKQMYPGKTHYMRHAFELATTRSHGYLLVDLKQTTPERLRLRSHIFPGEKHEVYVPEQLYKRKSIRLGLQLRLRRRGEHIGMSSRVKRQAPILLALAKSHPHVCKAILRGADKDLLHCLSECALNILRGNVPLKPSDKARLTKYC